MMGQSEVPNSFAHNLDFPSRVKKSTPVGTVMFILLRAFDVYLQYMLVTSWGRTTIKRLGGKLDEVAEQDEGLILGLPPYYLAMSMCSLGTSLKQIIWVSFTSEQEMPVVAAFMIATFNTVFNSVNTLLSLWAFSSNASNSPIKSLSFLIGFTIFAVGLFFEQCSEIQRKIFKSDPANKGKPYAGGLFSVALNINYGGYTLWRAGYAMVAAGWIWGISIGSFFFYDFRSRAIPILDKYCLERYGQAFEKQRASVPYRLIPGIW